MAAWAQIELHRDKEKRLEPFGLDEIAAWMGHGFIEQQPSDAEPVKTQPDVEDLMDRAAQFMQMFGERKANGTVEIHGEEPDHA